MNPLECQSHWRNLLHCCRREEQVQSVLELILRTGLMSSSPREPSAPGKPAALFSFGSEEQGQQFKSSVFKYAAPSNLGTSLLEGIKDHLISQAKSEVTRRDLQQRSQDAQHGYIESRREQVRRQEE